MKKIEDYTIGEVIQNCKKSSCKDCPFCYNNEPNSFACLFNDNAGDWGKKISECNGDKEYKQKQKEVLLTEFDSFRFTPTALVPNAAETAKQWRESLSEFLDYILEEKES